MTNGDQISWRRGAFFEYFGKRLKTAKREDVELPDRLLILSAALDALAAHWHDTADRTQVPNASSHIERMRQFLLLHGGHDAFTKVSAPMLRNDVGTEAAAFPFGSYRPGEFNEVRDWRDDPTFDELQGGTIDPKLLLRWTYPGILYKDLRCAWLHKFMPENSDIKVVEADYFDRDDPYYRYVGNKGYFLLIMPVRFLVRTVECAMASFQREADSRGVLPFKDA